MSPYIFFLFCFKPTFTVYYVFTKYTVEKNYYYNYETYSTV